jgi:hypothetical protein
MLIAAAALGSWDGLPRSLALFGLGEIGLIVGSLIYSYAAVQGHFTDDRWANLGWTAGAELSMLAAATIVLGIDRPLQLPARHRVPGHRFAAACSSPRCHRVDARSSDVCAPERSKERCAYRGGCSVAIAGDDDAAGHTDGWRSSEMLDDVLVNRAHPRRASARQLPTADANADFGRFSCGRAGVQSHRRENTGSCANWCSKPETIWRPVDETTD